jgi:hypothetical protein
LHIFSQVIDEVTKPRRGAAIRYRRARWGKFGVATMVAAVVNAKASHHILALWYIY